MIKKLLILSLLGIMAVPGITSAACDPQTDPSGCTAPDLNFVQTVAKALGFFFWIIILISVFYIMMAAYGFITAGGDPAGAGKAMTAVRNAAIGIIVAVLALGISKYLANQALR